MQISLKLNCTLPNILLGRGHEILIVVDMKCFSCCKGGSVREGGGEEKRGPSKRDRHPRKSYCNFKFFSSAASVSFPIRSLGKTM